MKKIWTIVLAFLVLTSVAWAHSGVKNASVKARMDAMGEIGLNTKIIGRMAKGQEAFDASLARAAAAAIADYAMQTPKLFQVNETDPKSEALPAIWESYDDFVSKSDALGQLAIELSSSIQAIDDLGPAMARLGGACKACHTQYRR
jgi:cytochrome c556